MRLPVRQFITAGSAKEEVPAKSTFTPAFVHALAYAAGDTNNDGYVTGFEAKVFASKTFASKGIGALSLE